MLGGGGGLYFWEVFFVNIHGLHLECLKTQVFRNNSNYNKNPILFITPDTNVGKP